MGRNKITDKIRNTFWKGSHYYGKKTRWDWNRGSCSECRSCHIYEKESTEKAKEKTDGDPVFRLPEYGTWKTSEK